MSYENDPLFHLAVDTLQKSAAINIGGQQVILSQPLGSHGAGLTDPDPSRALYNMLGDQRTQANMMNFLDGQVHGTNLNPYQSVLPENDQTIAYATHHPGMFKAAAVDEEELQSLLADSGLFSQVVPPDFETMDAIEDVANTYAQEKAASDTVELGAAMLNNGYLQALDPALAPYIAAHLGLV